MPFLNQERLVLKFLTFYFRGETYKIKSHITCNTVNVIYMVQCLLFKMQYIGETKRRFKDRFNEHRRPILNPSDSYIQTAVSEHFLSNSHSVSHMPLIPIEILRYERDCLRKASEAHLIHKPKPSSLWVWTNVTNINHYVLFILFSVYFSQQPHLTRSYHVTSVYYFTVVVYILHIRGFS